MRAIRFHRFGEPGEVLAVDDVPTPEPGPGQVRVRMRVRPINPSDLFAVRGAYGVLPELPAVAGMEGAGVVDAVGAGFTGFQEGQQVVLLGGAGTWQEFAVVAQPALMPLPPGLSDTQAAMLLANPTSAWIMLEEELRVQQGEWVLQNAANSAVGRFVIQLARHRGYRTINVVRRRDVIEELKADGADEVVCEEDEDVVARVREITGGRGVRHALDSVAGHSGSRLARCLAPGGTLLVFGAISQKPLVIDPGQMLFRGTQVRGWWLLQWFRTASPEQQAKLFGTLIPLVADGTLRAPVGGQFDLADVQRAVAAAEGSGRKGKILLVG
jgi:NADPH:quinone reductase-like Zn-dependent oxidoreductase